MISRRQFLKWLAGLGLSGLALAAYGFVVEPLRWPAITRYHVRPGPWPDGLTLKIAVLADIHACNPWMSAERIRSIVSTTNGLGADLIVLLGDYAAGHHWVLGGVDSRDWAAALAELRAPLGVHAISAITIGGTTGPRRPPAQGRPTAGSPWNGWEFRSMKTTWCA